MKLLFSTILAALMAASVQAVTVAWTLQNSQYNIDNWIGQTETSAATIQVFAFFAAAEHDAANAIEEFNTQKEAGTVVTANKNPLSGSQVQVFATQLNADNKAGYYYMVVFSGKNDDGSVNTSTPYAVAKTAWIDTDENGVLENGSGVYNNLVGGVPNVGDYIELNWMAESPWTSPLQTPEPTAMALLALGVAGLALRRKNV